MKIDSSLLSSPAALQTAQGASDAVLEKHFDQMLDTALQSQDAKKLYESCQQLESVFLNKVFEAMRASIPHSELINRGFAEETYESMLFEEYSKGISKTNSLGIADILYRQLTLNMSSPSNKE